MCLFLSSLFSISSAQKALLAIWSYEYSAQSQAYNPPGTVHLSELSVLVIHTVMASDCVDPLR